MVLPKEEIDEMSRVNWVGGEDRDGGNQDSWEADRETE